MVSPVWFMAIVSDVAYGANSYVKELASERELTILMVTHEPVAATHCREVFVLRDGVVHGRFDSEGLDAGGVATRYQQLVGAA